jgi:hypothetical protein
MAAQALADRQMELLGHAMTPSKNGLHSKWKNELASEIQDLERQKIDLFRNIVAAGYDPTVGITGADGHVEHVKMSETIKQFDARNGGEKLPGTPAKEPQLAKVLTLVPTKTEEGTDGPR